MLETDRLLNAVVLEAANTGTTLKLSDVTDFAWDHVGFVTGAGTDHAIEHAFGQAPESREVHTTSPALFVFFREDKIIKTVRVTTDAFFVADAQRKYDRTVQLEPTIGPTGFLNWRENQADVAATSELRYLGQPTFNPLLPAVLCSLAWANSLLVGYAFDFGPDIQRVGLAAHILSLVVAFGAILVVDWLGTLWLFGKTPLQVAATLESAARPLIWGGLALLLLSGALIRPDPGSALTWVKLVCILILMLNGVFMHPVLRQLFTLAPGTRYVDLGRRLKIRLMVTAGISQACWWTAVLIGLVNSTLRRWPS
ncbi:hypothetical protein ACFUOZ_14420 [Paenarthrobacter sp. NPDC057355]|uniref:hypothetical protein n=1 Tax=Paenarthrobacter sp. NPDC057355 TaxID=3346105 RepID=UPI003635B690